VIEMPRRLRFEQKIVVNEWHVFGIKGPRPDRRISRPS
jgi:hypothetical protein